VSPSGSTCLDRLWGSRVFR